MIISSLLDNDLYKFTQQQAVFHQFPNTYVTYGFKCRSGEDLTYLKDQICEEIDNMGKLFFKKDEVNVLRKTGLFQDDFLNYLRNSFQLDSKNVDIFIDKNDELQIEISGKWIETILWEVPILAIVSELYCQEKIKSTEAYCQGVANLFEKMKYGDFKFVDFGTRRRFSKKWHGQLLQLVSSLSHEKYKSPKLIGTSNLYYADMYDLKPIGTMAHEWFQACQALAPSVEESQKFALDIWTKEYGNKLQVALTDIFGIDVFLADLDKKLANQYTGFRQDSGSPALWAVKLQEHLEKLDIDPKTKTVVFSDGLNFGQCINLNGAFGGEFKDIVFGVGTNLTNDVGVKPLSIVIKMITCNGKPTAKISDSEGKVMCRDEEYIEKVKQMIERKVNG